MQKKAGKNSIGQVQKSAKPSATKVITPTAITYQERQQAKQAQDAHARRETTPTAITYQERQQAKQAQTARTRLKDYAERASRPSASEQAAQNVRNAKGMVPGKANLSVELGSYGKVPASLSVYQQERKKLDAAEDMTPPQRQQAKSALDAAFWSSIAQSEDFKRWDGEGWAQPGDEDYGLPDFWEHHNVHLDPGGEFATDDEERLYRYLVYKANSDPSWRGVEELSPYAFREWWDQNIGQPRAGQKRAEEAKEGGFWPTLGLAVSSGFDQFARGSEKALFPFMNVDTSTPTQYAAGERRKDLDGIAGIGFDAVRTVSNMAPSIALGTATGSPNLGLAAMAGSAGGGAMAGAQEEGYDALPSAGYGVLTALSEAALGKALGGITSLGGKALGTTGLLSNAISNIGNAKLRFLAGMASNTAGEALEEYLQDVLDPQFRNIALGEHNKFDPFDPDAAYSALMAAITTPGIEGTTAAINKAGNVVLTRQQEARVGQLLRESNGEDITNTLALYGALFPPETDTAKIAAALADKLEGGKKVSDRDLGRLYIAMANGTHNAASGAEPAPTAIDTDPEGHTPEQQAVITAYQKAADKGVLSFIDRWRGLKDPNYKKRVQINVAPVNQRTVQDIKTAVGVDISDFTGHSLSGNALEHIEKRHGESGEADHSMADPNDIARIGYVLENYDSVEPLVTDDGRLVLSGEYFNADGSRAPMVRFLKRVDGTYYVAEAVPDSAAKKMRVVSAYMDKASGSTDRLLNMSQSDPQLTSKTPDGAHTSATKSIVPQTPPGVNPAGSVETEPQTEREVIVRYAQTSETLGEMGRDGQSLDSLEPGAVRGLTDDQVLAAYTAGQADAELDLRRRDAAQPKAANSQTLGNLDGDQAKTEEDYPFYFGSEDAPATGAEEGVINDEQAGTVRVRDGGLRVDGAGAQGEAGAVAQGTVAALPRADRRGPADAGAGALQVGRKISTYDLGITHGVLGDTLYEVIGGTTEVVTEMRRLAANRGLELVLFAGGDLHVYRYNDQGKMIRDSEGRPILTEARAYINGNKVYVRVDHAEFTALQLYRHEEYHDRENHHEVDTQETMEAVREILGDELTAKLEAIYSRYTGGLEGLELWSEIAADRYAGMNIFAGAHWAEEMEILQDQVGAQTDAQLAAQTETAAATARRTGPPEGKTSVEHLPDGRSYVKADRQVIFGNDPQSWREQLEDYINGKIRRGEDVELVAEDGDVLLLTAETAGKVSSPYRGDGTTLSDAEYERKVNAGTHIDELVQVSRSQGKPKGDVDGRHGEFASGGWDYRDAYFLDFDGKYYQVTISAAVNDDGTVVYNIGKMRKRSFPNHTGSSAKGGAHGVGKASPSDSVAQDGGEVKGKFSIERVIPAEDSQGRTLTAEQQAHNKTALGYFGKTYKWSETGYLLLDGSKLDFSGRHEGGPGGRRSVDHREIRAALGDNYGGEDYSGGMVQFMAEGNIRISPESGGINLSVMPTKAQFEMLSDYISKMRGEVILDFDTPDGKTVYSVEYPRGTYAKKVLEDIRQYFESGTEPKVSDLAKFRFSREGDQAFIQELRDLKRALDNAQRRAEYWKKQVHLSEFLGPDPKAVRDEARALRERIGTTKVTLAETTEDLQRIYDAFATGKLDGNELTYEDIQEMAEDLARKLISGAVQVEDSNGELLRDIQNYLRTTQIIISTEDAGNIPDYGQWRRGLGGKLKLRRAGAGEMGNVDSVFHELAEMWPELFDEARYSTPSDQLLYIADILDQIGEERTVNPYSPWYEEAVQWATTSILDAYWNVPTSKGTLADQWQAKVEAAKAQGKEDVKAQRLLDDMYYGRKMAKNNRWWKELLGRAVADERARSERKMAGLKEWYKNRDAIIAANKKSSEARNKLLKLVQRMGRMKTNGANKALIRELIGELDTVSRYMTGKKRLDLEALRREYMDKQDPKSDAYDPDFIPDPQTMKQLDRLSRKSIDDMTLEDVESLTKALLNLEHEIRTSKRLLLETEGRDIYRQGQEIIDGMAAVKGSRASGVGAKLDKYLTAEVLSPQRMVRRMVGWDKNNPLLKATERLNEGQRTMLDYQMRAERPFLRFAKDKAFSRMFSGANAREVKIGGWTKDGLVEVSVTPAMRASIYLHSLNPQNAKHMAEGGVTVPDMKLYRKGDLAEAYARGTTVKIKPSDTQRLWRSMSETERAFVSAVQRYFRDVSQPELTRVAETLRGYAPEMLEHYFPIVTDKNFMHQDIVFDKDGTATVLKPGYMEERVHSSSPMMLQDVDSVVNRAIQQHSMFVGLAIPVRDFNKLWNVSVAGVTEDGKYYSYADSVKAAVSATWGKTGVDYIEKMVKDVQGRQHARDQWGGWLDRMRSHYAGAVLTVNLSVAAKQAASYPTAAAVLGWEPLARAMGNFGKVDLALIEKYTPLQWYRSKGFASQELGDMARNNKHLPKLLNWIQGIDLATTRKLWKASEYYVRANNKALKVGTDAYYKAVAEVYNRVIEETQPNYTVMQRPQMLRSENALVKNLAMFKTQPMQNLNILYDAAGDLLATRKRYKAGTADVQELKTARRNFGRAVTSQLIQAAVFAGMTAAWAFFRGRDDKYRDDEDEVTLASFLKAFGYDAVANLWSGIPFISDAVDYTVKTATGETAYAMEATSVSMVVDTMTAFGRLGNLAIQFAKGEDLDWKKSLRTTEDALEDISKAAGFPLENVVNLFNAGSRWALIGVQGKYLGEYNAMKMTTDPDKYSADYYDLLYKAKETDADAYRRLYDQMIEDGWGKDKIKSAMESRMKDAQGVEHAADLDKRYVEPEKQAAYDRALRDLKSSKLWSKATGEQRSKAKADAYEYLTRAGGEKQQPRWDKLDDAGVDPYEYAYALLARTFYDEPNENGKMGTYTSEEVEAAIGSMSGLTDDERRALWVALGKKEDSCPW